MPNETDKTYQTTQLQITAAYHTLVKSALESKERSMEEAQELLGCAAFLGQTLIANYDLIPSELPHHLYGVTDRLNMLLKVFYGERLTMEDVDFEPDISMLVSQDAPTIMPIGNVIRHYVYKVTEHNRILQLETAESKLAASVYDDLRERGETVRWFREFESGEVIIYQQFEPAIKFPYNA